MAVGLLDYAGCGLGERPFRPYDRYPTLGDSSPADEPGMAGPGVTAPISVLVVDDDPDMLMTLYDMLAPSGYRVVTAVDGADALAKFTRAPFDGVLTDLAMPRLNGLQLARGCKRIKPSVPVLMLTAWDVLLTDEDLQANGVDVALPKPVRASTLLRAIADATRRSAR